MNNSANSNDVPNEAQLTEEEHCDVKRIQIALKRPKDITANEIWPFAHIQSYAKYISAQACKTMVIKLV